MIKRFLAIASIAIMAAFVAIPVSFSMDVEQRYGVLKLLPDTTIHDVVILPDELIEVMPTKDKRKPVQRAFKNVKTAYLMTGAGPRYHMLC